MSTPLLKTCAVCGCSFRTKPSHYDQRKTCSRKCLGEYFKIHLVGENNPNYGSKKIAIQCPVCQAVFSYYPSMGKRICCSRQCSAIYRSMAYSGENNPQWKGGKIPYYGPNWLIQRDAALIRDQYTCQHCGKAPNENGRDLDVHHKKPFRVCSSYLEANQLANLICLCSECHRAAEKISREKYGAPDYSDNFVLDETMVSPQQAALVLGISVWAIYSRIKKGQLYAINLCEDIPSRSRPRYAIPMPELLSAPQSRYNKPSAEQLHQIDYLLEHSTHSMRAIGRMAGVTPHVVRKQKESLK